VNSTTADHNDLNVSDQPLSDLLVLHSDEAKASACTGIRISDYLNVADLSILRKLSSEITLS